MVSASISCTTVVMVTMIATTSATNSTVRRVQMMRSCALKAVVFGFSSSATTISAADTASALLPERTASTSSGFSARSATTVRVLTDSSNVLAVNVQEDRNAVIDSNLVKMVATNATVLHALMKILFFAEINNAYDGVDAATEKTIVATEVTKRAVLYVKVGNFPATMEKLALASLRFATALMIAETATTNTTAVCQLRTSFDMHSRHKHGQK